MTEVGPWIALAVMALVTYASRVSGVVIMSRVTITPRVRRGLEALSGSVIVAIILPAALDGDLAAKAAVAVAAIGAAVTRNVFLSMTAAVGTAAAMRAVGWS